MHILNRLAIVHMNSFSIKVVNRFDALVRIRDIDDNLQLGRVIGLAL